MGGVGGGTTRGRGRARTGRGGDRRTGRRERSRARVNFINFFTQQLESYLCRERDTFL